MNAPRRAEVFGADVGAVEFHMAPVDPILISDPLQSLVSKVPGVGDQTEGPVQAHRADIIRVPVHHRAGGNAGTAGDALRVQTNRLPLPGGWLDIRGFNGRGSGDKVWLYLFQSVDQGLEVHRQVPNNRDVVQRFEGDRPGIQISNQRLTGESFPSVDHQGTRAAHGKTAAIPERKSFILSLMDLEEGVEYGYLLLVSQLHEKLLFIRSRVLFRIETENFERVNHLLLPRFSLSDTLPGGTTGGFLSSKGQVIPNERESKGGKKKEDNEKDLLTLNAGSQIDQEYSYPQGGVKGHHEKQQELQRPAVREEEMECQKKENEDG